MGYCCVGSRAECYLGFVKMGTPDVDIPTRDTRSGYRPFQQSSTQFLDMSMCHIAISGFGWWIAIIECCYRVPHKFRPQTCRRLCVMVRLSGLRDKAGERWSAVVRSIPLNPKPPEPSGKLGGEGILPGERLRGDTAAMHQQYAEPNCATSEQNVRMEESLRNGFSAN